MGNSLKALAGAVKIRELKRKMKGPSEAAECQRSVLSAEAK
jgi:hypothetical protein